VVTNFADKWRSLTGSGHEVIRLKTCKSEELKETLCKNFQSLQMILPYITGPCIFTDTITEWYMSIVTMLWSVVNLFTKLICTDFKRDLPL
jgi:hypothetical protein